jgi:hypothetical protein
LKHVISKRRVLGLKKSGKASKKLLHINKTEFSLGRTFAPMRDSRPCFSMA